MIRLAFAVLVVLLAAPEPAPLVSYTLLLEEVGGEQTRPAGASLARPRQGPGPSLDSPLHSIEFDVFSGPEFKVKLKNLKVTRQITGVVKNLPDEKLKLQLRYQFEDLTDGKHTARTINSEIEVVSGQRIRIGGVSSQQTTTTDSGTFETRSSYTVWATLRKSDGPQ